MTSYGAVVENDESQTLLLDQEPGEPSLAAAPTSPLLRRRALSVSSTVIDPNVKKIFFMLGAAALLPWNAFINATPYFLSRLQGSNYHETFTFYASATFTLTKFAFIGHATASFVQASSSPLIRTTTTIMMSLIFLLALSPLIPLRGGPLFSFLLLNGALQSIVGAYMQTAIIGLASLFGPHAIRNVFTGQAAVGVVVSLVQYINTALSMRSGDGNDPSSTTDTGALSAFIFFGLSTAYLIVTLGAHTILTRTSTYQLVKLSFAHPSMKRNTEGDEDELNHPSGSGSDPVIQVDRLEIAKLNATYNFAIAYVFVVTLCVFPPITTSILSVHPSSIYAFFSPPLFITLHFLVFNVADWFGRYLCSFPSLIVWAPRKLLTLSLARTLFVPLFLACNLSTPGTPSHPPVVNSDIGYMLIVFAFGTSNGYVSSVGMMAAPSLVHNPCLTEKNQVDTAATVAQFCLMLGLLIGSVLSFGVRALVCDCNPFLG